mmetsp:Transcript_662/g.712  ORF Transcript_662/g.712 Transcript_662/m.712 type:complete len:108 (+) Transcript_662:601-924(+)
MKSLEEEKIGRKAVESQLSKLKEDFATRELEKDKLISELTIKLDKVKVERSQYELELGKTRDAQYRSEQMYLDKVNTLEDQLFKSQTLYVELSETTKGQLNRTRQEA